MHSYSCFGQQCTSRQAYLDPFPDEYVSVPGLGKLTNTYKILVETPDYFEDGNFIVNNPAPSEDKDAPITAIPLVATNNIKDQFANPKAKQEGDTTAIPSLPNTTNLSIKLDKDEVSNLTRRKNTRPASAAEEISPLAKGRKKRKSNTFNIK